MLKRIFDILIARPAKWAWSMIVKAKDKAVEWLKDQSPPTLKKKAQVISAIREIKDDLNPRKLTKKSIGWTLGASMVFLVAWLQQFILGPMGVNISVSDLVLKKKFTFTVTNRKDKSTRFTWRRRNVRKLGPVGVAKVEACHVLDKWLTNYITRSLKDRFPVLAV